MRSRVIFGVVFSLLVVSSTFAADRYARMRYVEGDVQIHSGGGGGAAATINTPVQDGDEIEVRDGRAEISFRNGIVVRLGDYSGVRINSLYTPMSIELLQGTLFVDSHLVSSFRDELTVQAQGTDVYLIDEGNMRVDLGTEGTVRVTAVQGEAEVSGNGRRVLVREGERTYVDPGNYPEAPRASQDRDELDDWNESRGDLFASQADDRGYRDYVGEDIYYDTYELDEYGDWREYDTYGNVWVPHVSTGWRPYYDGHWNNYGGGSSLFWISYEPWGWAPYHYGRWGWGFDIGWYWIPGPIFAPSWVSWYDYGNYIGWCPLNYYNRPIYGYGGYGYGYGYGYDYYDRYNRVQKQKTLGLGDSWTFVRKDDLGDPIRKARLSVDEVQKIKFDNKRITNTPSKTLANFVLPKGSKSLGYVNDKRIVKQPGDIKNPIGKRDEHEQFEIGGKSKSGGSSKTIQREPITKGSSGKQHSDWEKERSSTKSKGSGTTERSNQFKSPSKDFKSPSKGAPPKIESKSLGKPQQKSQYDRSTQFQRNQENYKRHYESYVSPYYRQSQKDGNSKNESVRRYEWPENSRYYRGDSNGKQPGRNYDVEVSPRYLEEARKYFERFDDRNHTAKPDYDYQRKESSRSYEQPRYEQPRYESPKRDYKAPEVKRPSYKSGSSKSQSSRGNSSKSYNRPSSKQKNK